MPELELCVYCRLPIKPEENSVKVPPAPQEPRQFGEPQFDKYAHAKCYEQVAGPLKDL